MSPEPNASNSGHVVVARKYRPQTFESLIGQSRVAVALTNAIATNRVGHAYLFCGARGVGKTSAARIFAKALNCVQGPTATPCQECDICLGVTSGDDVDVIEIDGASNRGIDEIRQLRSNVGVRPSRARHKIYIIDEVHMLTNQAFNALLKTLEEPPEHVKFIFCTTDPEKIPITVLSRCQRFDFASVETGSIQDRLKQICDSEGVQADDDALLLLARRAAGSMRDSQSLLEQLLSFCDSKLTAEDIHKLLGTASTGRLFEIAEQIKNRDAAGAIGSFHESKLEGVDPGQFAEQLVTFYRDMMVGLVGGDAELFQLVAEDELPRLNEISAPLGLEATLAIIQILDKTLSRLRQTTHGATLVEVAIVRICNLADLQSIADAIAGKQFVGGAAASTSSTTAKLQSKTPSKSAQVATPARPNPSPERATVPKAQNPPKAPELSTNDVKKNEKSEITSHGNPDVSRQELPELTEDLARRYWQQMLVDMGDMTAQLASEHKRIAISGPNKLVVTLNSAYNRDECERSERKSRIESFLKQISGRLIRVDFLADETETKTVKRKAPISKRQLIRQAESHPFVQSAIQLFDGEIEDVKVPLPPKK